MVGNLFHKFHFGRVWGVSFLHKHCRHTVYHCRWRNTENRFRYRGNPYNWFPKSGESKACPHYFTNTKIFLVASTAVKDGACFSMSQLLCFILPIHIQWNLKSFCLNTFNRYKHILTHCYKYHSLKYPQG